MRAATPPDTKQLRKFGLLVGLTLMGLFGVVLPLLHRRPPAEWPRWPWPPGGLLVLAALLVPKLLAPLEWLWMRLGGVLGWVNTRIILSAIFFALFTPIGLLLRLFGKDRLQLHRVAADSYRETSTSRHKMEEPF